MPVVAKVLKSYGTDGTVILGFRDGVSGDFDVQGPVFLQFEGLPVPFFFSSFHPLNRVRAEARFEGVDNLADAEELVGKEVSVEDVVTRDDAGVEPGELCVEDLKGFQVLSSEGVPRGVITYVDDYSGNTVLTLSDGSIIPYHDDLFVDVDEVRRTITLIIPAGL